LNSGLDASRRPSVAVEKRADFSQIARANIAGIVSDAEF
jgi:hypothetical protein